MLADLLRQLLVLGQHFGVLLVVAVVEAIFEVVALQDHASIDCAHFLKGFKFVPLIQLIADLLFLDLQAASRSLGLIVVGW